MAWENLQKVKSFTILHRRRNPAVFAWRRIRQKESLHSYAGNVRLAALQLPSGEWQQWPRNSRVTDNVSKGSYY